MNTVYRTFTKSALKKRNVISEETIKFSSTKVQCSSSIRACFSRYYVCCLFFVCVSLFLATMILSLSLSLSLSLTRANIILRIDTVFHFTPQSISSSCSSSYSSRPLSSSSSIRPIKL